VVRPCSAEVLGVGVLGYDFKIPKILLKIRGRKKWSGHGQTDRTADYGPGKITDRMEIFDANILRELVIEENSIAIQQSQHCNTSQYMYVTKCLLRSSNTCEYETCKVKVRNCVH